MVACPTQIIEMSQTPYYLPVLINHRVQILIDFISNRLHANIISKQTF